MTTIKILCEIVRLGNTFKVKEFLANNKSLNLNGTAEWFEPPIQSLIGFLSSGKVPVPSTYLGPMTPLGIATSYCHFDIVKALVESGRVDINARSGRLKDHTPLDCAIKWCQGTDKEKIIKYLISKGAQRDITKRDKTSVETLGEELLKLLGEAPKVVGAFIISSL